MTAEVGEFGGQSLRRRINHHTSFEDVQPPRGYVRMSRIPSRGPGTAERPLRRDLVLWRSKLRPASHGATESSHTVKSLNQAHQPAIPAWFFSREIPLLGLSL